MYAVIRAGGKQYRVAPGDVIQVEKLAADESQVQFGDVLAVSPNQGELGKPQGEARVMGQVLSQVLGDKVLVFHYKRKKQYKKLSGHRQQYTAVRITEIAFDGKSFRAPDLPAAKAKPAKAAAAETDEAAAPSKSVKAKKRASGAAGKAAHHSAKPASKSRGGAKKK